MFLLVLIMVLAKLYKNLAGKPIQLLVVAMVMQDMVDLLDSS